MCGGESPASANGHRGSALPARRLFPLWIGSLFVISNSNGKSRHDGVVRYGLLFRGHLLIA